MILEKKSVRNNNSISQSKSIKRSATFDEKQTNQKLQIESSKTLPIPSNLPENDLILPDNVVDREFECQICLDPFNKPILMPCHVHSICLQCVYDVYKKKKMGNNGKSDHLKVECPTCGQNAGQMKFKHLKINKELIRIMEAYKSEKQEIFVRNKKEKQDNIEIVTSREEKIKSFLNNSDSEQINDLAIIVLKKLVGEGKNIDNILDTIHIKLNLPSKKINLISEKSKFIILDYLILIISSEVRSQ